MWPNFILWSRQKEMFYLMTHSTHFIYGYMASVGLGLPKKVELHTPSPSSLDEKIEFPPRMECVYLMTPLTYFTNDYISLGNICKYNDLQWITDGARSKTDCTLDGHLNDMAVACQIHSNDNKGS